MVADRRVVIGLVVDNLVCGLSDTTKRREYVRKESRKLVKKHYALGKNRIFMTAMYNLANNSWLRAQDEVRKQHENGLEYSTVIVIKQLRPHIDSYYKLNHKNWKKLEDSYDLSKHTFASLRVANRLLKEIDESIARFNYNEK